MEADPGKVADGNLGEVHVNHENQGVYTLFSANKDAICIAWVTTSWSEDRGGNHYAVLGDIGYYCGATWYWSGMYYNSDEDELSKPPEDRSKCFWIDSDGDHPTTGFQVRWPAFSKTEIDPEAPPAERDPKSKCDNVSFGIRDEDNPNTIRYWTDRKRRNLTGAAAEYKGRQAKKARRSEALASQLIVGDAEGQSARFLCESETSVGPDFANTSEGLFCDMGEKILYTLCNEEIQTNCFALASKTLRSGDSGPVVSIAGLASDSELVGKTYDSIRDWRKNSTTPL